jgi:outer membrane cobalamin receptor
MIGSTRLRTSAGTGIRPPDAFEIAFTDNPSLKPERSRSFDVGVSQGLVGGSLAVDVTAFFNRYDDLIVAVGRSLRDASRYRTDNISNARARGLELSVAARSAAGIDARIAYTFLDAAILAADRAIGNAPSPFKPGDALLRRPRQQVTFDLAILGRRTSAYVRFNGRGRVLDVDPTFGSFGGLLTAPGFFAADAGAAFHLTSVFEIYGHVTNLFDRKYEEALGYPATPRTGTVGVRIAAGH